jgi:ubiquinone/menaquinone biosynthesis C-methylase UbiE
MTAEATEVYALGANPAETARLRRQSEELKPEAAELLATVGLRPGQAAVDLGCGPRGILDLLAAAVGPDGVVVGVDSDPAHVAVARNLAVADGLANVEVINADARRTGLGADAFDLVHTRTLLVNIPQPAMVVAEMVRLARPGGWVACQEPDAEFSLCHPELPAWDRMRALLKASYERLGADLRTGRRLPELFRDAGLEEVLVTMHAGCYPADHTRRTLIPDLVRSLRPTILDLGLADERELADLDTRVREHLADARTLMMPHLLVTAAARKPAG